MTKIALIYGSSRPSIVGQIIAKWFKESAVIPSGVELDLIDLAEVNLPLFAEVMPPIANKYEHATTIEWAKKIEQYDGFIFAVAEYNLGYTPILKNAIDTLFREWNEKPVALISYGAYPISSAAEQLKTVLTPFKMKVSKKTFHVTPVHDAISDNTFDSTKVVGDKPTDILMDVVNNARQVISV